MSLHALHPRDPAPRAADAAFLAWLEARLVDAADAGDDRVLDYLIGLALADAHAPG
jgi:hypothetical protein